MKIKEEFARFMINSAKFFLDSLLMTTSFVRVEHCTINWMNMLHQKHFSRSRCEGRPSIGLWSDLKQPKRSPRKAAQRYHSQDQRGSVRIWSQDASKSEIKDMIELGKKYQAKKSTLIGKLPSKLEAFKRGTTPIEFSEVNANAWEYVFSTHFQSHFKIWVLLHLI